MSVNAIAFYAVGLVIIGSALAAVVMPRFRMAAAAALVLMTGAAVLSLVSGAYALGLVQLVITVALGATFNAVLARREPYCRIAPSSPPTSATWTFAAAVAGGTALLLIVTFALTGDGWHVGTGSANLVTVLHYRAPYALIIAAVLVVTAVATALMLGRTSGDEREADRAEEARRLRDERIRRRREDRAAARRGAAPIPESRQ